MQQSRDSAGTGSNHRVVIVGGGFGGLHAAKALRRADAEVVLIDRKNYHLFQPLLYQVATGMLNPGDITSPLRTVVGRQKNTQVLHGELNTILADKKQVRMGDKVLDYDTLVLALGATAHNYFGNDRWEQDAPGLKSVEDAIEIRSRVLSAFEAAELEDDPAKRRELLTFVIIGGGPTGVELAGAVGELAHLTLPGEFRNIDPADSRVILLEGMDRVLGAHTEPLAEKAVTSLRRLGVEVLTGSMVNEITETGVRYAKNEQDHRIASRSVIWAGGVKPDAGIGTLAQQLGVDSDKSGRIPVNRTLQVVTHPDVYVIGDLAQALDEHGDPLPGLAAVAMQQGKYVGKRISRTLKGKPVREFEYRDRGTMATIGKKAAIADFGRMQLWGFPGWVAWLLVHLMLMVQFGNRLIVFVQWAYNWFTNGRNARMIRWTRETAEDPEHSNRADSRRAA
ncbi:NAD(P)/FAD-dependent oxidoreductase [bacterium]|nr:NAD(P)/FAD-dependent oxidoreductase [bacterium]